MTRRPALLTAGLATALILGACSTATEPGELPEDGTPVSPSSDVGDQEIAFEPCASYATDAVTADLFTDQFDCTRVQVPLDHAEPDGASGEVALLRLPATGDKIGSLLVNPGGPGGSGMVHVAALAPLFGGTELNERFDIIGFDPRGVGASTPRVECFTDAERDENVPPGPYLFPVRDQEAAEAIAQRCIEGTGGVEALTSVGSDQVVQDMDLIRAVLGDEKLSYLGYSYGSELGAMYAQRFPQNVRAITIDGAVHPGLSEPAFRQTQFTAFQEAFDGMAALCAAEADCVLGDDPDGATQVFNDLVRPLQQDPLPTSDGRDLTYDDVVHTVSTGVFSAALWPELLGAITALAAGDGDTLLELRDRSYGRADDGSYGGGLNTDANLAIRCMDNPRTQQDQDELLAQAREAAPFMDPGDGVQESVYECAGWPEPVSRDIPWATSDVEVPPTLVVSATGDPGTPHAGGVAMADLLGGSLLTVEGIQHGISFTGASRCVDEIVTDYLVNLRTPPDGASCTL